MGGESHQHERVAEKEITGGREKIKELVGVCLFNLFVLFLFLIYLSSIFLFLLKLLGDYGGAPNEFPIL